MKNILCLVDFSEVSLNAIEFATRLAEAHHGNLLLLNVFTERDFNQILEAEHINKEYNEKLEMAISKLKSISNKINETEKKSGLLKCNYTMKSGKLSESILEVVAENKIELIVMGSIGITSLEEKYIGSQTLKIIEDTPCSVMVIPEDVSFHKIKNIVYATDYQEEDKIAIQQVISLATVLKANIEVLHVSHSETEINKAIYEEFVEEIQTFTHYEKLTFYRQVFSKTTTGLKQFMHEQNADLLILLSKKRNFFQNLFSNSITKDLYEFSDFPFMVVKNV